MAKVIVERPRCGGDRSRQRRMGNFELLPTKEGMRQRWVDHKYLNENLSPLRRFLVSRVGRRWDAVYAELNEHLAVRNAVQQHVRTHISSFVALHIRVAADGALEDEWRWRLGWRFSYDLYVDPRDGILKRCRTDKVYRREAQQQHQERLAKRVQAEQIVLGPLRELHRLNGIWYDIEFARFPAAVTSLGGATGHTGQRRAMYDVLRREVVSSGERYAVAKRQLTTQELRQYGVQNLLN